MNFFLFLIWLIGIVYAILILRFIREISFITKDKSNDHPEITPVSIIIPFRNESENLSLLNKSIINQNYPRKLFTIYFINDHSTDNSKEIVENFAFHNGELNIEILDLEEGIEGKKAALQKAYKIVKSEIILCTDADCELPEDWIKISVNAFKNENIKMLCGGIKYNSSKNWLEQFQSIELMSLIGSSSAAIKMGNPLMNNGANLAFRKSVLDEIEIERINSQIPSGDDVFLMMEILKNYGSKAIFFEFNPAHWVQTKAVKTFEELVQQRIRWTSKSKHYNNPFQIFVSLLVLFTNISIPILFLWSLFSLQLTILFLLFWLLKMTVDFIFLRKVAIISHQKLTLSVYLNTAIIYPFFISYIAIIGQFTSFKWKGRKYSNK